MRISDWSSDVCSSDLVRARNEILASGTEGARIGLANSAVNMWSDEKLRQTSGEVLVELLKGGSKDLVAVVMDVFRVTDDLVPDTSTVERSEEHTSELQSLMRISYAVFCLKKKKRHKH